MLSELLRKIDDRTARVGVVGLGYVGIPLAMRISEMGLPVLGFDVLPERIRQMEEGISPIRHIPDADIAAMRDRGFQATGDYSRAAECDALLICVPTPLDKHREPDLRFVTATMDSLAPYLRAGQLLSLESTTWPGTTAEVLAPYFTRAGLTPGEDAFLVYSPEREDPGNPDFDTSRIPKVVGGDSLASQQAGIALYSAFIDTVVPVSSTRAAEMVKLLENIYRAVNIGLVNELKIVAQGMGLANDSPRVANDLFYQFAAPDEFSFAKTVVPVRLAQHEGEKLVSRSQAKRLTARFEKFKTVILDFTGVESIGQGFADELFRVFATAHPATDLVPMHMTTAVQDMTNRVLGGGNTG